MRNKMIYLAVLFSMALSSMAHADETADRLTKIEAETLLLKAREKQLEVQSSIISRQNEIAAKQNVGTPAAPAEAVRDPVVKAVEGVGGRMYATLQLHDGSIVDVQPGSVLPNGMKIVSIRQTEVMAEKNKHHIRLASYSQPAAEFNPNFPSTRLALPLPPAMPRGVAR